MRGVLSGETHWEKAAKTRMGKYLTQIETDFIFNTVDPSQMRIIMDVGAEAGRFSLLAKDTHVTVVGIDIDSYGLQRLKLKTKRVNAIQADARKIPLKDDTFDAIFMIEVLDYIPEFDEALRECHRTLKSNAPLILSFGNRFSYKSKLKELRGKPYRHSYGMAMRLLFKTGFAVIKKTGYNWLPFGRTSESRLVPFFAVIEKLFALRRIPSLSPWVIVHATKSS